MLVVFSPNLYSSICIHPWLPPDGYLATCTHPGVSAGVCGWLSAVSMFVLANSVQDDFNNHPVLQGASWFQFHFVSYSV